MQALYATRKKLTCTQWHVYGVEHMLPSAYILSHPGMGATVQTFYRHGPKGPEKDPRYLDVMATAESEPWKVGQVLQPRSTTLFQQCSIIVLSDSQQIVLTNVEYLYLAVQHCWVPSRVDRS